MNLSDHIKDLLTVCEVQLKDPATDKRAVRRTRAALESAYYTSMAHYPNANLNTARGTLNAATAQDLNACKCVVGARDKDCMAEVHHV